MCRRRHTFPATECYPVTTVDVIRENIASGSFSTVSKAKLASGGIEVAVKVSETKLQEPPRFLDVHPSYVPKTIYYSEVRGSIVVEEWLAGESLYELAKHGNFGENIAVSCGLKLAVTLRNLARCHHVYHGDITPSNVLVDGLEDDSQLWLVDFDPWYPINPLGDVEPPDISGSMPFLPPEYLNGRLYFNAEKACTYCVGAVVHYLAFGKPPYCHEYSRETVERLMFGPRHSDDKSTDDIQRKDYLSFRSMVSSCQDELPLAGGTLFNDTLKALLMFSPNDRIGLDEAIAVLERISTDGQDKQLA